MNDIDVSTALDAYPAPGEPGFSQSERRRLEWTDQPPHWGEVERRIREHDRLRLAYEAGGKVRAACIVCGDDAPREPFCINKRCRLLVLAAGNKHAQDKIDAREQAQERKERAASFELEKKKSLEERKQEIRANPPNEPMVILYGGEWEGKIHRGVLTPDDPYEPPAKAKKKKAPGIE